MGSFSYDFNKSFQSKIGVTVNRFQFPEEYVSEGSNKIRADIYYSRLKFAFSSNSFLNLFIQFDTNDDKVGWNLRYRYTSFEGTKLHIVNIM